MTVRYGTADVGLQMLVGVHLLPGDHHPRAVGAEHRMRRVLGIRLGIVAHRRRHLLGVVAGLVAVGDTGHAPLPAGVGDDLADIAVEGGHRASAHQGSDLLGGGLHLKVGVAVLQIGHGAAHQGGGKLQTEFIVRLQEGTPRLHESLADGAVGGLPEVAALGVLLVGAARYQHHFRVGEQGPRQRASVGLLIQMGEDEPLPVEIQ